MSSYEQGSTADTGQEREDLKERAVETVAEVDAAAMHVAGVAGEEAGHVAQEAKDAARGFLDDTRAQLSDQASAQQHRAAQAMRTVGDDFAGMAEAAGSDGMAAGLVRGLGDRTRHVATWLDDREPADLVRELRGFARRHTGAFLVAAVGLGIVAGRLTRAMMPSTGAGAAGSQTTGAGATGPGGPGVGTDASVGAMGYASGTGGMDATGAGGASTGAGLRAGDTPIGDALAGEPMEPGSDTGQAGIADADEPARDEWSPSGEARR